MQVLIRGCLCGSIVAMVGSSQLGLHKSQVVEVRRSLVFSTLPAAESEAQQKAIKCVFTL